MQRATINNRFSLTILTVDMLNNSIHKILFFWILSIFLLCPQIILAEETILVVPSPKIAATSYILQDFNSGRVLAEKDADQVLPPASLTKIMTVYVIFNELKNGHLTLDEKVTVSKKAWKTPGSRMFIEVNKQVTVENLLKGVIIQSGNDASVALAEHVAGTESTFAGLMNQHARRLGMKNTHFVNSTGLPHPEHHTTARDLAILARAVIKEFPEYYRWDSEKEFTYNGITQQNRNKLLWRDTSVDGVKTGHTEEAGYCLVASAKRNDMRLVSVVLGTKSENARANETQSLLNYGFRFFETHRLYKANDVLTETRVWKGKEKNLKIGLREGFYVTIPRRHYQDLKATLNVDNQITAPIAKGQKVGTIEVKLNGKIIAKAALIALSNIEKGNLLRQLYDEALLLLKLKL